MRSMPESSDNMTNRNKTSPTSAKAMAALYAMLAFSVCPTQAFQPSFLAPTARLTHRKAWSPSFIRPATVTMDTAPWVKHGDVPQRQPQGQHRRPAAIVFSPPGWYRGANIQGQQHLQVSDPEVVQDTDDRYVLSFVLPPEVDHDGLQVSVSGRLLTVKARITREEDPNQSTGGWITRSSRTESVSRSFVLPEGVLSSSASTSFGADGKVEVKFKKDTAAAGGTTPMTATPFESYSSDSTATGTADTPTVTAASPTAPADSAESALQTSVSANAAPMTADCPAAADDGTPSGSSTTDAAQTGGTERSPSHPESAFDTLDKEFRDFAEALWGDFLLPRLQVPTPEEREKQAAEARGWQAKRKAELAARVKAAKEAREKRVTAMRRATLAAHISQADDMSSYLVKFALPEGMARDNVNLTVNPDHILRVTVSTSASNGGTGPSVYRDVLLPKDAILSDVAAKFVSEHHEDQHGNSTDGRVDEAEEATANVGAPGFVSGLEVIVGRAAPPRPKTIDIV